MNGKAEYMIGKEVWVYNSESASILCGILEKEVSINYPIEMKMYRIANCKSYSLSGKESNKFFGAINASLNLIFSTRSACKRYAECRMNTLDSDSLFDYCIKAIESGKKLSKEEIIALKDSYEQIRKNR